MVQSSTLLQLIQFVGLITPALAILIELLVRFHGGLDELKENRDIPIEIQILFLGFSAILIGGMSIGVQMTLTLDDSLTQVSALLIFGGLPLLALSVLVVQIRLTSTSPSGSLFLNLHEILRRASTISLPVLLTVMVNFGLFWYFGNDINNYFSYWIFEGQIRPLWYFYGVATIVSYKSMYSLWSNEVFQKEVGQIMNDWFVIEFTAIGPCLNARKQVVEPLR